MNQGKTNFVGPLAMLCWLSVTDADLPSQTLQSKYLPVSIQTRIQWDRNAADFVDGKYSRVHQWNFDGGASLKASSSPDVVPLPYSDPEAVDPEEAFVVSISSCHMLWFLAIAAKRGFVVDKYQDLAQGQMGNSTTGKTVVTEVQLKPEIQWSGVKVPTQEELVQMHAQAHDSCFIANSVKTKITVVSS